MEEQRKPRFLKYFEEKSKSTGIPVEVLLKESRQKMIDYPYPTPDCLDPHEVKAIVNGSPIDEDRIAHGKNCDFCATVIAVSTPNKNPEG